MRSLLGKKRMTNEVSEYAEWYHVIRGVDVSNEEKREWILGLFGSLVLKGSPSFVRVATWPKEDKEFKTLMEELKAMSNVY